MRPIIKLISPALVLVFLCLGTGIMAQESWPLEECIRYAQEKNISVKRQGLMVQSSKSNLQTAQANRLPVLSAFASHNLSSGKTVNFEDYSYINTTYQDGNMGIRGNLTLFDGLSILNTVKQQKFALQAAIAETETLRNSIAVQVTGAFLQVLFAKELYQVAKEQHQVSLDQVESTKIFVEHGRMAKANLLEMKAQAAQDALALMQSENQVTNAKLQLAHLMNITDPGTFEISHPAALAITNASLTDPEQVFNVAMRDLPRIKGAEYKVKSSESGLAVARSRVSPSLNLNGIYYSRYSELGVDPLNPSGLYPYSSQLMDNGYAQASISLSIPLFSQLQTRNQISQAKFSALDAKLALDLAKNTLRQEIQVAYSDAKNALAKYEASLIAVESTEESHKYVEERYGSGLATSIDFNISKSQLVRTKSNLLQAKYEYILRSKILDFYYGNPIQL